MYINKFRWIDRGRQSSAISIQHWTRGCNASAGYLQASLSTIVFVTPPHRDSSPPHSQNAQNPKAKKRPEIVAEGQGRDHCWGGPERALRLNYYYKKARNMSSPPTGNGNEPEAVAPAAAPPSGEEGGGAGIDPETYQRAISNQGEGEKEGGEEDKRRWRDRWKSHLVVSGIVVVVLGVFVAFAKKLRERSS